jgi:hypothetical protein
LASIARGRVTNLSAALWSGTATVQIDPAGFCDMFCQLSVQNAMNCRLAWTLEPDASAFRLI